jgi:hypothetical protein
MKAAMPPNSTAPQISTRVGLSALEKRGNDLGSSATATIDSQTKLNRVLHFGLALL